MCISVSVCRFQSPHGERPRRSNSGTQSLRVSLCLFVASNAFLISVQQRVAAMRALTCLCGFESTTVCISVPTTYTCPPYLDKASGACGPVFRVGEHDPFLNHSVAGLFVDHGWSSKNVSQDKGGMSKSGDCVSVERYATKKGERTQQRRERQQRRQKPHNNATASD